MYSEDRQDVFRLMYHLSYHIRKEVRALVYNSQRPDGLQPKESRETHLGMHSTLLNSRSLKMHILEHTKIWSLVYTIDNVGYEACGFIFGKRRFITCD